jgi:uncharacterized membrane protein (UPF0127 family)
MDKSPKHSKQKKGTRRSQILVFLLLAVFALFLLVPMLPRFIGKNTEVENVQQTEEPQTNSPQFKKEGELTFISKSTNKAVATIEIELANTDLERMQGLMFRHQMPSNQGMLFVFDSPEPRSFWMKNTYISLDIIYVNEKKEIVSIVESAQPLSEESLPSGAKAQYVVEVVGGFCKGYGLGIGDKVVF